MLSGKSLTVPRKKAQYVDLNKFSINVYFHFYLPHLFISSSIYVGIIFYLSQVGQDGASGTDV